MSATETHADLRTPDHQRPCADHGGDVEEDEFAAARGIVLGTMLGAASLVLLAIMGWLLL